MRPFATAAIFLVAVISQTVGAAYAQSLRPSPSQSIAPEALQGERTTVGHSPSGNTAQPDVSTLRPTALEPPRAGALTLTRTTIDAGGAAVSSARFGLTATLGQPDVGAVSAGDLSLRAGFHRPQLSTGPVEDRIFSDRFIEELQP